MYSLYRTTLFAVNLKPILELEQRVELAPIDRYLARLEYEIWWEFYGAIAMRVPESLAWPAFACVGALRSYQCGLE